MSAHSVSDQPVSAVPERLTRRGASQRLRSRVLRFALPLLVLAVIVLAAITTPQFFTFDNARSVLINASVVGILAVGMTPITLSGNFVSLASQGSTVLSTMVVLGLLSIGVPVWLSIVVTLVVSVVVAGVQGLIVAGGLNPVITTLAAGSVIYGVLTVVTRGTFVSAPGSSLAALATTSVIGLPLPVVLFLVYTVAMTLIVSKTVVGRHTLLVGANRSTSEISGVSAARVTLIAFLSFGVGATLAGLITAAQLGQITSGNLASLTTDVIAAVLVGGVSIRGGEGSPVNSAVGAVLISIFSNVMLLQGLDEGSRLALVGALVVVLVIALHLLRRGGAR